MLAHELMISMRMPRWQAHVFVEIKCRDARKIEAVFAMHAHEFAVRCERRVAGRKAEHAIGFLAHDLRYDSRGKNAGGCGIRLDDDFHCRKNGGHCAAGEAKESVPIAGRRER